MASPPPIGKKVKITSVLVRNGYRNIKFGKHEGRLPANAHFLAAALTALHSGLFVSVEKIVQPNNTVTELRIHHK